MPIIQIKERKSVNQLGDLLNMLYENVLLYCETEDKLIKNDTKSPQWKEFVKSNQVKLVYSSNVMDGIFRLHKTRGIECLVIDGGYAKQDISDMLIFTNKKNRVFSDLFSHIRNAFAHNQIFVADEYVTMYDRLNQKSSQFTMISHMKISVLKELISIIKNLKNQDNENV